MNIKSLTTAVTAAALVSVIGLAYAQSSTYPPATSETTPTPMQPAPTGAPSDTVMPSATPSTSTNDTSMRMPSSTPSTSASDTLNETVDEPAPKADRN